MRTVHRYIDEGRLVRRAWRATDADGRELVCLLAALAPQVLEYEDPADCPADVMPPWLAHLTPWIDDAGTQANWAEVVNRFANASTKWHILSDAAWQVLDWRCRAIAVREACAATRDQAVREACTGVLELLERAITGAEVPTEQWRNAREAAAGAAAQTDGGRACDAADAAWDASWDEPDGVWETTRAAVESARAMRAASSDPEAASDRVIGAMLDAIEEAISASSIA